ncbi:hypothetical protein FRC08_009567 [Ceratobasidium sp. 394]|nr:hypothetical protein FRC08_009567 [Ceratobasidium sp. 394]
MFDPQAVSAKLALHEASQSLSVAAETLASAAWVMSKAAASLALASGNHTTEKPYEKRRAAMDRFGFGDISPKALGALFGNRIRMCCQATTRLRETIPPIE